MGAEITPALELREGNPDASRQMDTRSRRLLGNHSCLLHYSVRSAVNHLMTLGIWQARYDPLQTNTKFYQITHFARFRMMRSFVKLRIKFY